MSVCGVAPTNTQAGCNERVGERLLLCASGCVRTCIRHEARTTVGRPAVPCIERTPRCSTPLHNTTAPAGMPGRRARRSGNFLLEAVARARQPTLQSIIAVCEEIHRPFRPWQVSRRQGVRARSSLRAANARAQPAAAQLLKLACACMRLHTGAALPAPHSCIALKHQECMGRAAHARGGARQLA